MAWANIAFLPEAQKNLNMISGIRGTEKQQPPNPQKHSFSDCAKNLGNCYYERVENRNSEKANSHPCGFRGRPGVGTILF